MKSRFCAAIFLTFAATLYGCGGESLNQGTFAALGSRGYLIKADGSAFSTNSVVDSVEVISAGTASYSVRFLLTTPLGEDEQIEILARQPVASNFKTIFVLKKSDLIEGSNSDFWATLNITQVADPFVPTSLLTTQIRTAAQIGEWQFKHSKGGVVVASGYLLPDGDVNLNILVPDLSEGLKDGKHNIGTIKRSASAITIQNSISISDKSLLGTVKSCDLVVFAENDPTTPIVLEAPLRFTVSPTNLGISSEIQARANDLSPAFDTQVKYLAIGIQQGFAFLRINVEREGAVRNIFLKVGLTKP